MDGTWADLKSLNSVQFVCGHCARRVASDKGYFMNPVGGGAATNVVVICPNCNRPSFFSAWEHEQIPGVPFGNRVENVPEEVGNLYDETRRSTAGDANTLAVMGARKLLMHIAVDKGAPAGKTFLEYVEYLAAKGFVPPDGKSWVDHIRTKGNEANHEIKLMSAADAQELINFVEMLLKFIYEFPARVPKPAK